MAPSGGRPSHDVDLLIAMILAEMLDGSGDRGASDEGNRESRRPPAPSRSGGKPPEN